MDSTQSELVYFLIAWLLLAMVIGFTRWRRGAPGVGLVLGYLLSFFTNYWVGPFIHALPWYQAHISTQLVVLGLEQALYATIGVAIGTLVVAPAIVKAGFISLPKKNEMQDQRLPKVYLVLGALFSFALTFVQGVSTVTAIVSAGTLLLIAGLCLCCWQALQMGGIKRFAPWLIFVGAMPLLTMTLRGYLGAGAMVTFYVLIFLSGYLRARVGLLVCAVVLGYVGMSLFVTYMRDRDQIRSTVWGDSNLTERTNRVQETLSNFDWFDPMDSRQLDLIDGRMNQSFLVGAAVSRLTAEDSFLHGTSIWEAFLGLIPRIIWPDKPGTAGSGTMVADITGIQFSADTSVGIGQVLEFYANFGTPGVIICFAILGTLLAILDLAAAEHLKYFDLHGFVTYFLPGLTLLQVGGSLFELFSSTAACLFVVFIVNRYLERLRRQRQSMMQSLPLVPEQVR